MESAHATESPRKEPPRENLSSLTTQPLKPNLEPVIRLALCPSYATYPMFHPTKLVTDHIKLASPKHR